MPIACDPDQTIPLWLASDKAVAEKERPTYVFRFLSGRQWRKLLGLTQRVQDGKEVAEVLAVLDEVKTLLASRLDGFRRVRDEDGLEVMAVADALDILQGNELMELAHGLLVANTIGTEEKSKSASPSGSATEAPPAPVAGAAIA